MYDCIVSIYFQAFRKGMVFKGKRDGPAVMCPSVQALQDSESVKRLPGQKQDQVEEQWNRIPGHCSQVTPATGKHMGCHKSKYA